MKTDKVNFIRQYKLLIFLIPLFILVAFPLQADDEVVDSSPLYLYYFETDDVRLETDQIQEYEFTAFRSEFVTMVVYGLDGLITPQLTLRDSEGNIVATGKQDANQSFVQYIQFTAPKNDNYIFEVKSVFSEDGGGIARVMLVEGEAISTDLTYLDTVNPLLPGRVFMVAGSNEIDPEVSETEVGLRVGAEVLPVERFTLMKPDIFVSRGSTDFYPPIGERFNPDTSHIWFNEDGEKFYFFTVHALPEELTSATENVEFKEQNLNLLTFFYYDYLFIVGKGSDPVVFGQATQPCSDVTLDDRAECERAPAEEDETFFGVDEEIGEEEGRITSVTVVPPEILPCEEGGSGLEITITAPVNTTTYLPAWGGSDCGDIIDASTATTTHAGVTESGTNRHFVYYIYGFGGNDIIYGSDTDDVIWPGFGADTIFANDGDDTIVAEFDFYSDFVDGGDGIDTLDFSEMCSLYVDFEYYGSDGLYLDFFYFAFNRFRNIEAVVGSPCSDDIYGDANDNTIYGGEGSDYIIGRAGADTLYGEAGNDYIYDGIGNDTVYGGDGDDTVFVTGGGTAEDFDGGDDTDTIYFNNPCTDPNGGAEIDMIAGDYIFPSGDGGDFTDFEIVYGSSCADEITDSTGDDIIYGRNGDDTFNIQDGNDQYLGNAGNDTFTFDPTSAGNFGNDSISGGIGNDTLDFFAVDNGEDNVGIEVDFGNVSYTVYNNSASSIGTGTFSSIEVIEGSISDDTFYMTDATYTIDGHDGTDTVDFSNIIGVNSLIVDLNLTTDTYTINTGATTTGNLENIENVIGTSASDEITGDANDNTLEGRGGADTLNGGIGNDTLYGNNGADTLNGGANDDTLDGGNGNDIINGGSGSDTILVSSGNDTINGGAGLDDILDFSALNTGSSVGASVNLNGTYSAGGGTATGSFSNIETIVGTNYDDSFTNSDGLGSISVEAGDGYDSIAFNQAVIIDIIACESTCSDGSDGGADITTTLGGLSVASSIELVYGSSGDDVFNISGDFQYTYESGTLGTSNDTSNDFYISGGGGSDSIVFDSSTMGYFIIDSANMNDISYSANEGTISFVLDADSNTYHLIYQTCNGGNCTDQTDSNVYITFDTGGTLDPAPLALSTTSGSMSVDPMAAELDASLNTFASALDTSTTDAERDTTLTNAFPEEETIADELSLESTAFDSLATANLEPLNEPEPDTTTTSTEEPTTNRGGNTPPAVGKDDTATPPGKTPDSSPTNTIDNSSDL